jgi:hypothetical protein
MKWLNNKFPYNEYIIDFAVKNIRNEYKFHHIKKVEKGSIFKDTRGL